MANHESLLETTIKFAGIYVTIFPQEILHSASSSARLCTIEICQDELAILLYELYVYGTNNSENIQYFYKNRCIKFDFD